MSNCFKLYTLMLLTVGLISVVHGRRGSYGNRRPGSRFPSRPSNPANQVASSAVASPSNGAVDPNGDGINGQKRFVAQLVSGMIGGVAEQAVFMCPQMCENMLMQLNAINPTMVGIFQGFIRCPNACQMLDSVVQVGLGVTDALVEG